MLTEMFDKKCLEVSKILAEREKLLENKAKALEALEQAERVLDENNQVLQAAMKQRDELSAALSIAPEVKPKRDMEEVYQDRQKVMATIRQTNDWITPAGIALLVGLEPEQVASILRRASKVQGIPLQHNLERGRGSMYKWIGDKKE